MGNVNGLYDIIWKLKATEIYSSSTDLLVVKKKKTLYNALSAE